MENFQNDCCRHWLGQDPVQELILKAFTNFHGIYIAYVAICTRYDKSISYHALDPCKKGSI